ncbi:MAG: DUF4974 domain-containing protein [Bacteroidales bacterium]|nr:DUF4974 domain-containing protein [Bacteroidales bacterium]MBN2818174.1 DUF4974 domain-containing protein [Bacteroidales bacterium]
MKDKIDKLFKHKIEEPEKLPAGLNWTPEQGWENYNKDFLQGRKTFSLKYLYIALAAACIAFFAILLPLINSDSEKIKVVENTTQEVMQITLPDGSLLWLNKNTRIQYPARFKTPVIEIFLEGEAYFEIDKSNQYEYLVKAFNASVRTAVETAFNIRAFANEKHVTVTVARGGAKVSGNETDEMVLVVPEGSYCSVNRSEKLIFASVNSNQNFQAWRTGRLIFDYQSVASVADILAEYFNTEIEITDKQVAYCMFTGEFHKKSIDEILQQIQSEFKINIEHQGSKIILSGKGC